MECSSDLCILKKIAILCFGKTVRSNANSFKVMSFFNEMVEVFFKIKEANFSNRMKTILVISIDLSWLQ